MRKDYHKNQNKRDQNFSYLRQGDGFMFIKFKKPCRLAVKEGPENRDLIFKWFRKISC